MLHLLAQAAESTMTVSDGGLVGIVALVFLLAIIPLGILIIVSYWKIFTKANQEGWKSLIPFYNIWVLTQIVGRPGWWAIIVMLTVVPFVNFVVAIPAFVLMVIVSIDLAKSFGKDPAFGILLLLLPIVGYPMLAFGKAQYIGPGGQNQQPGLSQAGPGAPPVNPMMPPDANAASPQQPQPQPSQPQPQPQQQSPPPEPQQPPAQPQPSQQPEPQQPQQPQPQTQQPEPQSPPQQAPQQPQSQTPPPQPQPNDTVQPTNQDEQQSPPSQPS